MVLAFDSKEYRREREIEGVRKTVFYSPLGAGVKIEHSSNLYETYRELCEEKRKNYAINDECYIFSSSFLRKKYGDLRTTSFLESIIYGLSNYIEKSFLSYVWLPPEKFPMISVGGTGCPTINEPTMKFLTKLNPMYSYLTAWIYYTRHRTDTDDLFIDSFSSKHTLAWRELQNRNPKIFRRGDEVNLPISIADAIAYVTDKRLGRIHQRIDPDNIEEVWKGFDFDVETRFLNHKNMGYYKWYNFDDIDWRDYQARPVLFLDLDALNMKQTVKLDPFNIAVAYVSGKGGSIQGFDVNMDSERVRDGDIYIYAGEKARNRANMFKDIYDIETLSLKELRSKIEKEK